MELLIELVWKIGATAFLLVGVVRIAERTGAFLASTLLTLPLNAGPGFLFLALDQSPTFISNGALVSFAATAGVLIFSVAYINLARHFDFGTCLVGAIVSWFGVAVLILLIDINLTKALILIGAGSLIAFVSRRHLDLYNAPSKRRSPFQMLLFRGLIAGGWAAGIASIGHLIGAEYAGLALGFPIIFCTAAWAVHRHYGSDFASALLSSAQRSLVTYASFCLALHLLASWASPIYAFVGAVLIMMVVGGAVVYVGLFLRRNAISNDT